MIRTHSSCLQRQLRK